MVARSMPLYDLMLLLDPTAPGERQEAILGEVQGLLKSGGQVVGEHDWGTRRLAFEIDHRPEAAYHLVQFETANGGDLLDRIDHSLKIMDGVLRHRIIRLKDGSPPPPMPRPEGRRDWEPAPEVDPAAGAGVEGVPPAGEIVPEEAGSEAPAADATAAEVSAADDTPAEAPAAEPEAPAAEPEAPSEPAGEAAPEPEDA
jgi:small subunit ribosomal protein S6